MCVFVVCCMKLIITDVNVSPFMFECLTLSSLKPAVRLSLAEGEERKGERIKERKGEGRKERKWERKKKRKGREERKGKGREERREKGREERKRKG